MVTDVIRVPITLKCTFLVVLWGKSCDRNSRPDDSQADTTEPVTFPQQTLSDLWIMLHYHHISLWRMEAQDCSCMNTHTCRPFPQALLIIVVSNDCLKKMLRLSRVIDAEFASTVSCNWWP